MNEGILSKDFPQPSLAYFTLSDDEGVQLIHNPFFSCGVNLVRSGSNPALVAQLVEHRAVTREVVSSSPAGPTLRVFKELCLPFYKQRFCFKSFKGIPTKSFRATKTATLHSSAKKDLAQLTRLRECHLW